MVVALVVVLRDVSLISGAVYKRASSLGWEVKLTQLIIRLPVSSPV